MNRSAWVITVVALVLLCSSLLVAGEPDSSAITPPQVKARTQMSPFYPAMAAGSGVAAEVTLSATVSATGRVVDAEVLDCDVPGVGFEVAAEEAVRQWRFKPATQGGAPVSAVTYVRMAILPPVADDAIDSYSAVDVGFAASRSDLIVTTPRSSAGFGGAGAATRTSAVGCADLQRDAQRSCGPGGAGCLYDRSTRNERSRLISAPRSLLPPSLPGARDLTSQASSRSGGNRRH